MTEPVHPGAAWRAVLAKGGHSLEAVARAMPCSRGHLSRVVNGRAMPTASLTVAFAVVTGESPEALWDLCAEYQLDLALRERGLTRE